MARRMVAAGTPNAAVQRQGRWKHGDMVARYTRGEAAGEALKWLSLTYATPALPTRGKHSVRHELGACREFPLIIFRLHGPLQRRLLQRRIPG